MQVIHEIADFAAVAESIQRSVVQVRPDGVGGAGVVLMREGRPVVVTNAHVARGEPGTPILVVTYSGRVLEMQVERIDANRDLAVLTHNLLSVHREGAHLTPNPLSVNGEGALLPATMGDISTVKPGHFVIAVGHPFGLANAVTTGVVHAVGPIEQNLERAIGRRGLSWVQADIRLAPGNSGGPLCDTSGRVLGINTIVAGGLALAVPIAELESLWA